MGRGAPALYVRWGRVHGRSIRITHMFPVRRLATIRLHENCNLCAAARSNTPDLKQHYYHKKASNDGGLSLENL